MRRCDRPALLAALACAALALSACQGSDSVARLSPTPSVKCPTAPRPQPGATADFTPVKTCMEAQKAELEARKLQFDIDKARTEARRPSWLTWLFANLTALSVIGGAAWALWQYFRDQQQRREESRNLRFRDTVAGLGGETLEARIGAAGLLATFLDRGNETFFVPVFKLAAGYLRPPPARPRTGPTEGEAELPMASAAAPLSQRPDIGPMAQMMASVFKRAYPLAVAASLGQGRAPDLQEKVTSRVRFEELVGRAGGADAAQDAARRVLDAENIVLDGAYLSGALFSYAWLRLGSFEWVEAQGIVFTGATLRSASFRNARIEQARFDGAGLDGAVFDAAVLPRANFVGAIAPGASFRGAKLGGAKFAGADLTDVDFTGADFAFDAGDTRCDIEGAYSLKGARLLGATGLTSEQLAACARMGAQTKASRAPRGSRRALLP